MKSLGVRIIIENDVHELFEFDGPDENWSCFAWRMPYNQYLEDHEIPPNDPEASKNWYWCVIGRVINGLLCNAIWFYDDRWKQPK